MKDDFSILHCQIKPRVKDGRSFTFISSSRNIYEFFMHKSPNPKTILPYFSQCTYTVQNDKTLKCVFSAFKPFHVYSM